LKQGRPVRAMVALAIPAFPIQVTVDQPLFVAGTEEYAKTLKNTHRYNSRLC
jgi:hypothetical protein